MVEARVMSESINPSLILENERGVTTIIDHRMFNNQVHVENVDSSESSVRNMQAVQSVPVIRPRNNLILTSHDSADQNIDGENGAQVDGNITP